MLVPLYGFVQGDTLGLLVLARAHDTIAALTANLRQAACMRIEPRGTPRLVAKGVVLDTAHTVQQAGLTALDRIDQITEGAAHDVS